MDIILVIGLIIIAILLFWQAGKQQRAAGLPAGRVIYTDTGAWGKIEQPLYRLTAQSGR